MCRFYTDGTLFEGVLQDLHEERGGLTQEEHAEYQECKRYLLEIGFLRDITSSANDD